MAKSKIGPVYAGGMLRRNDRISSSSGNKNKIHESISACDIACMVAIASSDTQLFLEVLKETGNTVCGRHPIGVIMVALEHAKKLARDKNQNQNQNQDKDKDKNEGKFHFLRYERSSDAIVVQDSSVSYVSAVAVPS